METAHFLTKEVSYQINSRKIIRNVTEFGGVCLGIEKAMSV